MEETRKRGASAMESAPAGGDDAEEAFTAAELRRRLVAVDRAAEANEAQRLKHSAEPALFMESELELNAAVLALQPLAAALHLCAEPALLQAVPRLLQLLTHENVDIALAAVALLRELCEVEDEDDAAPVETLVRAMLRADVLPLLVQNLSRLEGGAAGSEEAEGFFGTLHIVENLCDLVPEVAGLVAQQTKLIEFLLAELGKAAFSDNQLYASEILTILLQHSEANLERAAEFNAVERLLKCIARYRRVDHVPLAEEELVANLFDACCAFLLVSKHKRTFVELEGIELMLIMMRKAPFTLPAALRVLDFVLQGEPTACQRFVEVLGLKSLFPVFMGRTSAEGAKKVKKEESDVREHCVSILVSLTKGLDDEKQLERLLRKFAENDFEKTDRLFEEYVAARDRLRRAESKRARMLADLDEDEQYVERLSLGLATLQHCCVLIAFMHTPLAASFEVPHRLAQLMQQHDESVFRVLQVLAEFAAAVDTSSEAGANDKAGLEMLAACVRSAWGLDTVGGDAAAAEEQQGSAAANGSSDGQHGDDGNNSNNNSSNDNNGSSNHDDGMVP